MLINSCSLARSNRAINLHVYNTSEELNIKLLLRKDRFFLIPCSLNFTITIEYFIKAHESNTLPCVMSLKMFKTFINRFLKKSLTLSLPFHPFSFFIYLFF